jgi:hypothetical protein
MGWVRHLLNNTDLPLGLALSVVLGSVVGLAMGHPLGHLILGSALGVIFLLTYSQPLLEQGLGVFPNPFTPRINLS